jgi:hypothetical protein
MTEGDRARIFEHASRMASRGTTSAVNQVPIGSSAMRWSWAIVKPGPLLKMLGIGFAPGLIPI